MTIKDNDDQRDDLSTIWAHKLGTYLVGFGCMFLNINNDASDGPSGSTACNSRGISHVTIRPHLMWITILSNLIEEGSSLAEPAMGMLSLPAGQKTRAYILLRREWINGGILHG
jgi:hypothetical protein